MFDLLARSGTWERTVIRAELAAEVGVAITEGEYQRLLAESAFGLRSVLRSTLHLESLPTPRNSNYWPAPANLP